ncbi:hypothetical protein DEJ45_02270 [Streptomyces venezuelae]|uniref:PKD domain-containing protein n=1 Tax=Streptomyces venezuelae TaxID=54571 RepID=UPI00123D370D|nr:hypothetical protein [Streptomyces venezuelae]QES11356.1 hypothetical protein DEJ45_02270 [Streptomyces venezuelae]
MGTPLTPRSPLQVTLTAAPAEVTRGETVRLRADTAERGVTYAWSVSGGTLARWTAKDAEVVWDTRSADPGVQDATVVVTDTHGRTSTQVADVRIKMPVVGGRRESLSVRLEPSGAVRTESQALWTAIRNSSESLGFGEYQDFIDLVLCRPSGGLDREARQARAEGRAELKAVRKSSALPYPDVDAYWLLKTATEAFMRLRCGILVDPSRPGEPFEGIDLLQEQARYQDGQLSQQDIETMWQAFVEPVPQDPKFYTLPYFARILDGLRDVPVRGASKLGFPCDAILRYKLTHPCLIELLWNYWEEESLLVRSLIEIGRRFQNMRRPVEPDPLAHLELAPLLPLGNLLWGYIQDAPHRLSVVRRAYEYDHHYGITLIGRGVPPLRAADSRSKFLEAFHSLLKLCTTFYTQADDMTVTPDGFPVLNGLKEVHLLLTEGQHNQYGDLPWTARQEMLMQQWLLARPEMRHFLPARPMVAYPEPWMGTVDVMKKLQGWTDTPTLHFHNLAVFGERILLSIRFGDWNSVIERDEAASWARYWRAEIQGYIHAYRAATGVDLTSDRLDVTMPAVHLRRRRAQQAGLAGRGRSAVGGGVMGAGAGMAARRLRRMPPSDRPY